MTNTNALTNLSTEELARLAALIADVIAAREPAADAIATEDTPATSKARKSAKRNSGEWDEIKIIHGHAYRYHRFWQGGRLCSKYIGKA